MKVLAITQARYGSTRLPAKILKVVNSQTLLEIHLRRILKSQMIDKLKVATTDEEGSKYIVEIADKVGVDYYKGSVEDVLSRFYGAAESESPDYVVRLTSDCPLIDPGVIDALVQFILDSDYDYVRTDPSTYPDGLDTEVMRFPVLKKAYEEAGMTSEREHVTPYIWKNGTANGGSLFKTFKFRNPAGTYSADEWRITIDEPEDFEVIRSLIENVGVDGNWKTYIDYLSLHKDIYGINSKFSYNEGYDKSVRNDSKIK